MLSEISQSERQIPYERGWGGGRIEPERERESHVNRYTVVIAVRRGVWKWRRTQWDIPPFLLSPGYMTSYFHNTIQGVLKPLVVGFSNLNVISMEFREEKVY